MSAKSAEKLKKLSARVSVCERPRHIKSPLRGYDYAKNVA